jgi:hypothetical protein
LALNLPFRAIENPCFQHLLKLCAQRSNIDIPGRTKLGRLIGQRAMQCTQSLQKELESVSKFALTHDDWSSPNHLPFMAVVAYYITPSWELKEILVGFEQINGLHNGVNLARTLLGAFSSDVNITRKILSVTSDNASNNTTMAQEIGRLAHKVGIEWDAEQRKIPCLAHVIQLVVKDIVDCLKIQAAPPGDEDSEEFEETIDGCEEGTTVNQALQKVYIFWW